jgi:hypothetical protein
MTTKEVLQEIKIYIMTLINKQFMYPDEIIDICIERFRNKIRSDNPRLTIKNQLKNLTDEKLIGYYHGYKITSKGKSQIPDLK